MGVIDNAFGIVRKVGAAVGIPLNITAAADEQGMSTNTMLGPGQAISPTDGFSRVPRSSDYRAGVNIAARPRSGQRVNFSTLRGMIESYDIAQICITHRIDSIRSYGWSIVPEDGIRDDMTEAIALARSILRKPDGELYFKAWLAKYLYDVLAFDAGCLYKIRNRGGDAIGLRVIDGTTIAPLLDGWGNRPTAPADAYVQYVQGMPWNWLTADDLIYAPFRPTSNSPYGKAPLESILINANTDLRFQLYFLQRFTAGTIPEGFAVSPETWTPDQLEAWQKRWDALMYGDQEIQHQIKWVPGGTSFEFPNKHDFSEEFSLFLMRKTAAAFHIPPNDLGFTEDVNRATGDSQENVSERVGDLPLKQHVEEILSSFLQDDLGLPLKFQFDEGGQDEDKLQTAQADEIYINSGVVSASKIAEMRFGIVDDEQQVVPRFIMTSAGPVALSTFLASSGAVAAENAAPLQGSITPAVQTEQMAIGAPEQPVAKDLGTEVVRYTDLRKSELAAFRKFARTRTRNGSWRDFAFEHVDAVTAHRLNVAGYAEVRKADGEVAVAGLAVRAADTGRVLMLQRALDPEDPAAGTWEFPGGHVEMGESPLEAAFREWAEEVGEIVPSGTLVGQWAASNGIYAGHVWEVATEAMVPPRTRGEVTNPDDPDGDAVEAIAWWAPDDLVGNPAVRAELAADLPLVLKALDPCPCCAGVGEHTTGRECYGCDASGRGDDYSGPVPCDGTHPHEPVADPAWTPERFAQHVLDIFDQRQAESAGDDADPLVMKGWRDSSNLTPQHAYDLAITDHYAPLVDAVLLEIVDSLGIATIVERYATQVVKADEDDERAALIRRVRGALTLTAAQIERLQQLLERVAGDAYATGVNAAAEQLGVHAVTAAGPLAQAVAEIAWDRWVPGDPAAVLQVADGALRATLDGLGITVKDVTDTVLDTIGNRIGDGLLAGHGSDKIERDVRDLLGGREGKVSSRAERIVYTEVARAQTAASFEVYREAGVTEYELVVSEGACELCLAEADENPHPLDYDGARVPLHPFCRCANSPVVGSIVAPLPAVDE